MATPLNPALAGITPELVEGALLSRSLRDFIRAAWPTIEAQPWVSAWHTDAICAHLEAVTKGQITKLAILVPPGTSKSSCVSVFWPLWEWTLDPAQRWLFQSFSEELVLDHAMKCRNVLGSDWFRARWPTIQLKKDQNQKGRYDTTAGGYRVSTTVGGQALGLHPTRICWDDPNARDLVGSAAERKFVNDSWDQTISTRGVAVGVRKCLVQQRLHEDDAAGHILGREKGWVVLVLPMRYEPKRMVTTPLGWNDPRSEPGELLDPVRYPEEIVADLEFTLASYGTASQLQQRPAPIGGGLIQRKHLRFWQPKGEDLGPVRDPETGDAYFVTELDWTEMDGKRTYVLDQTIQSWDTSYKGEMGQVRHGHQPDPVSGVVLGRLRAAIFLLDRVNKRMGGLDAAKAVVALTRKWPNTLVKLIEGKANGPMMRDILRTWGVVTQESNPDWGSKAQRVAEAAPDRKSKDARAMGMAAMVEAGEYYLPHPKLAPWVWTYLAQLCMFPNTPNDDDVDSTSQGFAYLLRFIDRAMMDASESLLTVPFPTTTNEIVRRQLKALADEEMAEAQAFEDSQYADGPLPAWLSN